MARYVGRITVRQVLSDVEAFARAQRDIYAALAADAQPSSALEAHYRGSELMAEQLLRELRRLAALPGVAAELEREE